MSYSIATCSLLSLAILWLVTGCEGAPTSSPSQIARPVKSLVVALQPGQNTIVQTGEIRPRTETSQGFRLDGRIISRAVDVGSLVKAGEVIATLDPRDSENQLNNAEADLNSALSAERLAKLNLTRMERLAPGKAIAQMELDQAKSNWELMVARRQNAQIAVKSARERLGYTRLIASEDGVITSVSANPGQVVNAGQEVVRLASLLERDAVFDVPERLLGQQLRDPLVSVSLLSDPAIKAVGHIRDISPQADAITRSFRVRVALDQPAEAFVFGATVPPSRVRFSFRCWITSSYRPRH